MTGLPPMKGTAPSLSCSRLLRYPDESSRCPNDATHHVIWTEDVENGLVCDFHRAEVETRWMAYAIHPYTLTCSTPGAVYVHSLNRCLMPDQLDTTAPAKEATVNA